MHFVNSAAAPGRDTDWLWCVYSGSAPSQYPLGEIQLTVRHSSQRNKLIVVVHSCRWAPNCYNTLNLHKVVWRTFCFWVLCAINLSLCRFIPWYSNHFLSCGAANCKDLTSNMCLATCEWKHICPVCPQQLDSLHQRRLGPLHTPLFAAWQESDGEEEDEHNEEDS